MAQIENVTTAISNNIGASPPHPSSIPVFFQGIEQLRRDFVIYDNGWRGWSYSYSDVARMARSIAAKLRQKGLHKGDYVVIWSESRPGWIASLWACLLEGFVLVPVEPQTSLDLLRRIVNQVKPLALLLGDDLPDLPQFGEIPILQLRELEEKITTSSFDAVALMDDDLAEIVYTSGTTAEPKGVMMTHRNLAACLGPLEDQLAPYRKYLRLLAPFHVLNLLPMSHLFGQAISLFVIPLVPGTVVFMNTTNPEEIVRQIRARKICALVSVPKLLEVLREFILHRFPETETAPSFKGNWIRRWWRFRNVHHLFGWRFCCLYAGGAALAPNIEQFWSGLGFVVSQGYGLTETAPIISFNHPFHNQKGTAGKPMAGVQVKIAKDGEVLVRGDNVTPGYFQRASETAAAFENGWLHTGDIGELNQQGDLIIRGRKKEVIVTPDGLKVYPEDVEDVLNTISGVRESAVLDKNGVHAVLVLEPGIQAEVVVRSANQRLEVHQRIRSFTVWTAGPLPRTDTTQKLRRGEIASIVRAGGTAPQTTTTNPLLDLVRKYAPGRSVGPETTLEELGLSSLDRVELMLDLEDKLNIDIDDSAFASIQKVADLAKPVVAHHPIPQPTYNRTWWARAIRRILLPTIFLPATRMFAQLKITGIENLRGVQGPVVFASNHQSYLDAAAILASLPFRWRYRISPAMWMEFFDAHFFPKNHTLLQRWGNSILYWLVTVLFNAFPLSQVETATRQSLQYTGELVEEGWSILIFPEGERTMTGEFGIFYPGVAMIASRMQIPVVPIHLIGLDHVLHKHTRWPRRGPVEVRVGPPIFLEGKAYGTLTKQVEDAIRDL